MSDMVFGGLTTNRIHTAIHILLGIIGIYTGLNGRVRVFLTFFGIFLSAVGVLWFVPAVGDLIVAILNVNRTDAVFNIIVEIVPLIIAFAAPRTINSA